MSGRCRRGSRARSGSSLVRVVARGAPERGSGRGRSRRRPTGGSGPAGARRASCRATLPCSVDRLERVRRAGRVVAADLAVERADQRAVGAQQPDQQRTSARTRPRRRHCEPTRSSNGRGRRRVPRTTPRRPAGAPGPRARRDAGQRRRAAPGPGGAAGACTRLRATALPDRPADHEADPGGLGAGLGRRHARGAPPACGDRPGGRTGRAPEGSLSVSR